MKNSYQDIGLWIVEEARRRFGEHDHTSFTLNDLKEAERLGQEAAGRFASERLLNLQEEQTRLEKRNKELDLILSLSSKITSPLYLSEVLKATIEDIFVFLEAEVIIILLFEPKRIWLASRREITSNLIEKVKAHIEEKIGSLAGGKPDLSAFKWTEQKMDLQPSKKRLSTLFSSSLLLPLFVKGKELGLFSCARPETFRKEDTQTCTILLNVAAAAIDKAILYQKAEDDLDKTKEDLLRSEKMTALGKMASKVSHDLRSPLSVILVSSILAKQKTKEKYVLDLLDRIERSGNKMKWLLDELSISVKEIRIIKQKIDITQPINESISCLDHKLSQIEKVLELSALPQIMGDRRQLERVFTNIIENAAQAMEGRGRLEIKAWAKEDGFIRIEITNSGPGIPEEIRERIFNPFFTSKDKGIGLGLTIVKEIVELHGGSISVESRLGAGTTFRILLPVE